MKLDEIEARKKLQALSSLSQDDPIAELGSIFEDHGWTLLGTGAEAAVATHPSRPYVLKVFEKESLYTKFVNFVESHPTNPHVPKFSRYVRPVPGTDYLYVRMEMLQSVNRAQLVKDYFPYIFQMNQMGNANNVTTLPYSMFAAMDKVMDHWGFAAVSFDDPTSTEAVYQRAGGPPPQSWTQVIKDLITYSKQHNIRRWDMHAANFMTRGNTLVISDPFYS